MIVSKTHQRDQQSPNLSDIDRRALKRCKLNDEKKAIALSDKQKVDIYGVATTGSKKASLQTKLQAELRTLKVPQESNLIRIQINSGDLDTEYFEAEVMTRGSDGKIELLATVVEQKDGYEIFDEEPKHIGMKGYPTKEGLKDAIVQAIEMLESMRY